MPNKDKESWEDRFKKELKTFISIDGVIKPQAIKDFISNELSTQREKIIEVIQSYRFSDWSGLEEIYNQVDEIIERIKQIN